MATYFFATDLVGFRSSTLRVRATERRDGYVWVVTADLLDAGTKLVLRDSQVQEVALTTMSGSPMKGVAA